MTKAEKIYTDTRHECRRHIEEWGYETNQNGTAIGFNGLITELVVSTRTLNDITKFLEREKKNLEIDKKLNILNDQQAEKEQQILSMIEITLNNQKRRHEEFQKELKDLK